MSFEKVMAKLLRSYAANPDCELKRDSNISAVLTSTADLSKAADVIESLQRQVVALESLRPAPVADDLPGMWDHSDLIGGETDCDLPAPVVVDERDTSVWLIASGNDGMGSQLVIGWKALRRAWLETHYCPIDHDNLDDHQRETLAILDDEDQWSYTDDRERFALHVSYEGDWASVTRVTSGLSALQSARSGQDGGDAGKDAPVTAEWCRAFPKSAAWMINRLAHQIDATPATTVQAAVAKFDEMKGRPVLLPGAPILTEGQLLYTTPVGRDSARLDWLEQHDGKFYNLDRVSCIVGTGFFVANQPKIKHSNVRAAIDTAMAANKEQ